MAESTDLERTYSTIDFIFRRSIGETGDYSGALFDGDFSLTLAEAQQRKHQLVLDSLQLQPGQQFIDLGCGWGGLLSSGRETGFESVGLTLSSRQAASCRRNGLDVHVHDCREITPELYGTFDAVASLGAFEHFCSPDEYQAGQQ